MKQEMIHNKLARDKIPDILKEKGIDCLFRTLNEQEYGAALNRKLQEEVLEYLCSQDSQHSLEELSDILEVIHAILAQKGISLSELEKVRQAKRETKGGFFNRLFLEKTFSNHSQPVSLSPCLFCQIARQEREADIVAKFHHCYVIKDRYPVSKGHLLIIPYEHTDHWFTAREEVRLDIVQALHFMKTQLDQDYQPAGYNIGANCGETAGQTVMHLHVHLIPRYQGDVENPKGGVRGVIPSKQKY